MCKRQAQSKPNFTSFRVMHNTWIWMLLSARGAIAFIGLVWFLFHRPHFTWPFSIWGRSHLSSWQTSSWWPFVDRWKSTLFPLFMMSCLPQAYEYNQLSKLVVFFLINLLISSFIWTEPSSAFCAQWALFEWQPQTLHKQKLHLCAIFFLSK